MIPLKVRGLRTPGKVLEAFHALRSRLGEGLPTSLPIYSNFEVRKKVV